MTNTRDGTQKETIVLTTTDIPDEPWSKLLLDHLIAL